MDSKERFSNKASDYEKYRPSYPEEFIAYLGDIIGINRSSKVADIGAGTGILTRLVGEIAGRIYAVEPNANMRRACEKFCEHLRSFTAIPGSAEKTELPDGSVDFITVGQAFHWFDPVATRIEFQRILKAGGKVILVWNRREQETGLAREYANVLRQYCSDFAGPAGRGHASPEALAAFFRSGIYEERTFENNRMLTLEAFVGNSLSASHAPSAGDANYLPFIKALTSVFHTYSQSGKLPQPMMTRSYAGEV
ncbi:MAG: class I SAM-dependent methyltransferase [Capsulimonadaceae bacterium]|nr:class I SAM-dependent methyltransferase [Capsulimonadaceae bacterium]